jgi:predicted nucleic acid-binding protein
VGGSGAECFLIDTSAASRLIRLAAAGLWTGPIGEGRISICDATETELLYSARSAAECRALKGRLARLYTWRVMPDDAWQRAQELLLRQADVGCHRSAGVVDLLVAVTAQYHQLTVLHYDRDFETVAKHTDLRTHWLAEPGSID